MRLWSIHPCYLDRQGLLGLWREGLLALAVLQGKTRGYKNHPQLQRFKETSHPVSFLTEYLYHVALEMVNRGYKPDFSKIPMLGRHVLNVTEGQASFEAEHLRAKLIKRDSPNRLAGTLVPSLHPMFNRIPGGIEGWERTK
jgi:hypothetical protein